MGLKPPHTRVARRLLRGRKRLHKTSGGFATIGLVSTVIGAMALTLFGVGSMSRAIDVFDGNMWLWSAQSGSTQRVNIEAGTVDMRYGLKDAKNHDVNIVQTDTHLLLHDRTAGTVTSIDLSNLDEGARLAVQPGIDSSVAMWNDTVLLVDAPRGQIRRLDPQDLKAKGKTVQLTPGLVPGGFDSEGRYWIASPEDGAVSALVVEKDSTKLRVEQKVAVAQPNHKLTLTALDKGAAVIDQTGDAVVLVNNNKAHTMRVPGLGSAIVATRTTSPIIAVTVPDSRQVVLIEDGEVRTIGVEGAGLLGEAVVFEGRVYVIDSSGAVLALDTSGKLKRRIATSARDTSVTMEQREGALIINEPGGPSGYVVNKTHNVKKVTKYTGSGTGPDTVASNVPKKRAPKPTDKTTQSPPATDSRPAPSPGDNKPGDNAQPAPETAKPSPQTPAPGRGDRPRAPGAPVLENVRGGDGRITLDYYPPNNTGGSGLTAIDIYCNNSRVIHDTNPGNGKQNASFRASNGVACTVQGYAINSAGSSAAAIGGTVTPVPATPRPTPTPTPPPPATNDAVPTGVRASVASDGSIQVTWNAVTVPAGSRLESYKIYACTTDGATCFYTFTSSSGNSATFPRPEGGYGTGGRFRVTSVIDGKESARSAPSNAIQ